LASILLLALVFAVLMAGVNTTLHDRLSRGEPIAVGLGLLGATLGALVGLVVAVSHTSGCLGWIAGFLGGTLFGGLAGALAANPNNILVAALGSVVVLGYAAWVRWHAPPNSDPFQ
jgi:hypothetical protein